MSTTPKKALPAILEDWDLWEQVSEGICNLASSESHADYIYDKISQFSFSVNRRFKTCAGLVRYREKRIELNPALLDNAHMEERNSTLLHETAHALAYIIYRHKGHGVPWKTIMKHINAPDMERCHQYPFLLEKRNIRYIYECRDCGYQVKRVRKMHKHPSSLSRWYHPQCAKSHYKGRFTFHELEL